MSSSERLISEQAHYDDYFSKVEIKGKLLKIDDSWLAATHEYHGFALRLLGDVQGLKVLVAGCGGLGGGGNTVWLTKKGASVMGVDIAKAGLAVTEKIAFLNRVSVDLRHESADKTGFPSETFDRVLSYGVLHHLDIEAGAREFHRVLKKGGTLVMLEPWDGNLLLRLARAYLWYPGKNRTEHERPLNTKDLTIVSSYFKNSEVHFLELFSALTRVFNYIPVKPLRYFFINGSRRLDKLIMNRWSGAGKYCRVVAARFTK